MKSLHAMIHAAIDGELDADEQTALEDRLANDAEARKIYDQLVDISTALQALSTVEAPSELKRSLREQAAQLQKRYGEPETRARRANSASALLQRFRQQIGTRQATKGTSTMNNQEQGTFGRGKVWGVVGVLAVAVGLIGYLDLGSENSYLSGVIAPAERYRDNNITADDVVLGDDDVAQLLQSDAFIALIEDDSFAQLMADVRFTDLMASSKFRSLMADHRMSALMADYRLQSLMMDATFVDLMANRRFEQLMADSKFENLMADSAWAALMADGRRAALMSNVGFQQLMANRNFHALMANRSFSSLLSQGRVLSLMADSRLAALMADGRMSRLMADARVLQAMQNARLNRARITQ